MNKTDAASNTATNENCSFKTPAILIVNTMDPVKRGLRIPLTLPIKAASVLCKIIVLIPI